MMLADEKSGKGVVGKLPELEKRLLRRISTHYHLAKPIKVQQVLFNTSNEVFAALERGEIDTTSLTFSLGSMYNDKPRRWQFLYSCTGLSYRLSFFVNRKLAAGIANFDEMVEKLATTKTRMRILVGTDRLQMIVLELLYDALFARRNYEMFNITVVPSEEDAFKYLTAGEYDGLPVFAYLPRYLGSVCLSSSCPGDAVLFCFVLSCFVLFCFVLSRLVSSCLVLSRLVSSYSAVAAPLLRPLHDQSPCRVPPSLLLHVSPRDSASVDSRAAPKPLPSHTFTRAPHPHTTRRCERREHAIARALAFIPAPQETPLPTRTLSRQRRNSPRHKRASQKRHAPADRTPQVPGQYKEGVVVIPAKQSIPVGMFFRRDKRNPPLEEGAQDAKVDTSIVVLIAIISVMAIFISIAVAFTQRPTSLHLVCVRGSRSPRLAPLLGFPHIPPPQASKQTKRVRSDLPAPSHRHTPHFESSIYLLTTLSSLPVCSRSTRARRRARWLSTTVPRSSADAGRSSRTPPTRRSKAPPCRCAIPSYLYDTTRSFVPAKHRRIAAWLQPEPLARVLQCVRERGKRLRVALLSPPFAARDHLRDVP